MSADWNDDIWTDYFSKLVKLAKRKLGGLPLRDGDEEDVAVSAMNSFYQALRQGKIDGHQNKDDLWKLLVTITARKATSKRRKFFAQKRGEGNVRGESVFAAGKNEGDGLANVISKEPVPEFAALIAENCNNLLRQLTSDKLRQIAVRMLEGYQINEIAEELSCSRRTVERKLELIRENWKKYLETGEQ
ncbi:DNA-directed RNA polymerase sigma-70 factor [Planctomycetales bacterium]|nr:DNA-directed RNA polymerase sigma-70 factor [Planctomycetales bacterium]